MKNTFGMTWMRIFVLTGLIIFSFSAYSQCKLEFESKVEKSINGTGSDILVMAKQADGTLELHLVDLLNPEKGVLSKKTISASELKEDYVVVFKNVEPSIYTIQVVDSKKCQTSVGGVKGITVGK